MASPEIWCRHGAHANNNLTSAGEEEVRLAAMWVAKNLREKCVRSVTVIPSKLDRTVQSARIYADILHKEKITVTSLPPDARLNPAVGVASWLQTQRKPYGSGLGISTWANAQSLPQEVESFDSVGRRAVATRHEDTVVVYVCHGGTIEPALAQISRLIIEDLPSAAAVMVEKDYNRFILFDPANPKYPTEYDF